MLLGLGWQAKTIRLQDESPISIQTQSLALRALRKRKPQETQALAFLAVYATHAAQAIAFEWKPGLIHVACYKLHLTQQTAKDMTSLHAIEVLRRQLHSYNSVNGVATRGVKKGSWICIAPHCEKLTSEALRHGSHSFYAATTPHLPFYLVKHSPDGATTDSDNSRLDCSLLLIYRPQEDERLSWPS